MNIKKYTEQAVALLCKLIATQSFSKEEEGTAQVLMDFLKSKSIAFDRIGNNIICKQAINEGKPILVLNSHHDTVRATEGWTVDPFTPTLDGNKITGLGSNDAGGCLVSLLMCFLHYYKTELPFQLYWIASCEEEISGKGGLRRVLQESDFVPSFAIVGEPTETNLAIAEKGLLVLDGYAKGTAGHAAHPNSDNALVHAVNAIQQINAIQFEKVSEVLGPVKLTVTQINAGTQHNVVPDLCHFVVDCRINEEYSNQEVLEKLQRAIKVELKPRSTHLNSSKTPIDHPIVQRGIHLGKKIYGSPTLSDQVFFQCPSVKVGPGDSARSHQADEFILVSEIEKGIEVYIRLLEIKELER